MKRGFAGVLVAIMLALMVAPVALADWVPWGYAEDDYYSWGPGARHHGWDDWHPDWDGPHEKHRKQPQKQPKKERFTEGDYTQVTLTESATLYENLGNTNSKIGTLSKGAKVRIMATYGDWQRVIYGSKWDKAAYIRTSQTAYK